MMVSCPEPAQCGCRSVVLCQFDDEREAVGDDDANEGSEWDC